MKKNGLFFFFSFFINFVLSQSIDYLNVSSVEGNKYGFTQQNPFLLHFKTNQIESIDTMLAHFETRFHPLNALALNQGPSDYFHWIALPLENVEPSESELFFTLKNSAINQIRYFWLERDSIIWQGVTGDNYCFANRPYPFCNFSFPVKIHPKSRGILILELDKRNENFFCGFDVMKSNDFRKFEVKTYWVFGIFTGIILITIAVNLFLFFSLKDKVHLWYGLYAFSNLFLLLSYEGMDFQFIYPEIPFLSNISRYITTGVTYILLFQVFVVFVKEGLLSNRIRWLVRGVQLFYFSLICVVIVVFSYNAETVWGKIFLFRVLSISGSIALVTFLFWSWREYRNGHKPSLLFFFAIALLLTGSIEYVLNINGWYTGVYLFPTAIPSNMQICLVMEVVVVFFAIFYRYKVYRNERLKLQLKLLESENTWRQQLLQGTMAERNRIAMDVHDGIGSRLFGARIKLDSLLRSTNQSLSQFQEVSDELLIISKELKNVILSLSKNEENTVDQIHYLSVIVKEMFANVNREVKMNFLVNDLELKRDFLMDLQLMMMEMANNVIRHSPKSEVVASIEVRDGQLLVRWEEKSNYSHRVEGSGLGLLSIQNRFLKWNGKREESDFPFNYSILFALETVSA